jgi:hypothetical protein
VAIKSFFQIRFAVGKGVCVCAKCARSLSGKRFEEDFYGPPMGVLTCRLRGVAGSNPVAESTRFANHLWPMVDC